MLFSLVLSTLAANTLVVTTYPCQRLGWAWRNVWVTCSIDSRVPGIYQMPATTGAAADFQPAGTAPNLNEGFRSWGKNAYDAPSLDVDIVGTVPTNLNAMVGGATLTYAPTTWTIDPRIFANTNKMPVLCEKFGAPALPVVTHVGVRTACRRAVDLYGSLLELCRNPTRARIPLLADGVVASNTATLVHVGSDRPWTKVAPHAGLVPHAGNAFILNFLQQQCIAPGQLPLGPANSCPGLTGWWTVTFQACNFAHEFMGSTGSVLTPAKMKLVEAKLNAGWTNTATADFTELCGAAAASATQWMPAGPTFHRSACRRAIDQFTRAAHRCNTQASITPDPMVPAQAALIKLAMKMGLEAPKDCA